MNYRHELKHLISYSDMLAVRSRLKAIASYDEHACDGKYFIRSLYFDNLRDKALREKTDGVNVREKFRIRCYDLDPMAVFLEKKSKINNLCSKEVIRLSRETAEAVSTGNFELLSKHKESLAKELFVKMKSEGIKPKVIVDYTREAFIFAPGNVRVTIDTNIRTGLNRTDFLNRECVTLPTGNNIVLEVKWDSYLPDIIKDAVQLQNCRTEAFSKYAQCRIYM